MKEALKLITGLAGALSLSLSLALPTLAQTSNPSPTDPSAAPAPANPSPSDTPGAAPSSDTPGATPPSQVNPSPSILQERPYAPVTAPGPSVSVPTSDKPMTLAGVVDASPSFEMLNALLPVANLQESDVSATLTGSDSYTVFAPTDEAFAALPEGTIAKLVLPENRDLLVKILQYHIVRGSVASSDITPGEVASAEGSPLLVQVDGTSQQLMVNNARVLQADIKASNGIVHAIDKVMLPPDVLARLGGTPASEPASITNPSSPAPVAPQSAPVAPQSQPSGNPTDPIPATPQDQPGSPDSVTPTTP